jgi:hypothetical protein
MKSYSLSTGICMVLISANVLAHASNAQSRMNLAATVGNIQNISVVSVPTTAPVLDQELLNGNVQPTIGVMSDDVAKQRLKTYGIDNVSDFQRIGNNYQIQAIVDGVQTDIQINGLRGILKNQLTQTAIRPPFADYERVMNWGESIVDPELLSFTDKQIFDYPPYKVRYYPSTNTYLGFNPNDGMLYIYNPNRFGSEILPLEPLSNYLSSALQEGF